MSEATQTAPAQAPAQDDEKGKGKGKRGGNTVRHPALQPDAEGNPTVKVEAIPEDFDRGKHKPFRKEDFTSDAGYYEWRAGELEERAAQYRRDAELIRKGGDKNTLKKAKRLEKMMERMEALKAELADSGVNTEELLASLSEDEDDESEAPAEAPAVEAQSSAM